MHRSENPVVDESPSPQAPAPTSTLATTEAPTAPTRGRVVALLAAVVLALVGGGTWLLLRGGGHAKDLFGSLPADTHAAAVLDWKRVVGGEGFAHLTAAVEALLQLQPRAGALYRKANLDLRAIESVTFGLRGTKPMRPLFLVRGTFDRPAMEAVLRQDLQLQPSQAAGVSVFGPLGGPGGLLAGFLDANLIFVGPAEALTQVMALRGGQGKSLSSNAALLGTLDHVDSSALLVGVANLPDSLRGKLAPGLLPARVALSVADERDGLTLLAAGEYAAPADAEAVLQKLEGLRQRGHDLLGSLGGLAPDLKERFQTFLSALRLGRKGTSLTVGASLKLGGQGGTLGGVGGLASLAIPAFTKYLQRARTAEARVFLRRMARGATSYYERERVDAMGTVQPRRFPPSVGPTPTGNPCDQPGRKFAANPKAWEQPAWRALAFEVSDPHYYRYEFTSAGEGPAATFTARALGDPDCTGTGSTFEQTASVDASGRVLTAPVRELPTR